MGTSKNKKSQFKRLKYRLEPNYTEPLLKVPPKNRKTLVNRLAGIYGNNRAEDIYLEVERVMRIHCAHYTDELKETKTSFDPEERFTERDIVLITYGDLIVSKDKNPLKTLADFSEKFFRGVINTIHLLPFFPYSSDRGFSVVSYDQVDSQMGTWKDIDELGSHFKLMFDGVINHCSAKSKWFQRFLNGEAEAENFFFVYWSRDEVKEELKHVFRPRTSELLSEIHTINGPRYVWTTFSEDQIDLNYKNPKVLIRILEILLNYVRRGADIIRLDAITYLWRELGSSCIHLRQTHEIVKLLRDVLDVTAPHVALITETNVPHKDNIAYFGNGSDEAQMVYNFALPPLVLHTFITGDSTVLTRWVKELKPPTPTSAFFNFLDSHDGIGVMGAREILSEEQVHALCERVIENGGFVSMKSNTDGTQSPYEMNITWFSALNREDSSEPVELQVNKFIASRVVALVLRGVPGIYLPSIIGSKNDVEAVYREKSNRSINRATLSEESLLRVFSDPDSLPGRISKKYISLLEKRINEPAFHPNASQEVYAFCPQVFALLRCAPYNDERIFCIINVTDTKTGLEIPVKEAGFSGNTVVDLVSGKEFPVESDCFSVLLDPYQIMWLKN